MNEDIEKLKRLVAAQVAPQASEVRPLLIAYDELWRDAIKLAELHYKYFSDRIPEHREYWWVDQNSQFLEKWGVKNE